MATVKVKTLPEFQGLLLPEPATAHSAGVDLRAAVHDPVTVNPGERVLIPAGIKVAIPEGYEWQIRPRSGLALKKGITVLNSPGTIDSDYRGPVGVILINHGSEPFTVFRGDRIAQAVLAKVEPVELCSVDILDDTERGEGGFGHSGI
ncbi:dUTP diphosphatase [Candidatus Fermentibacteria bacterium]|nr:MAG: dUTP diphosphatase [Candidatus Fermentibacteria bacterium]